MRNTSRFTLQAAIAAGDAERVRALFGFTTEEFEAANARVLALDARADEALDALRDEPDEAIAPEGWDCRGVLSCGFGVMGIAYLQPQLAIGILAVGGAICAWDNCRYEGASPETRTMLR
jgi:hypothetical protein